MSTFFVSTLYRLRRKMGNAQQKKSMTPQEYDDMIKNTDFSSAEIEQWHTEFSKDFPKGKIKPNEFKAFYRKMFPEGNADDFCKHIFRIYDIDNSGDITFNEFMATLSVSTPTDLLENK